jgi:hypothetical protein
MVPPSFGELAGELELEAAIAKRNEGEASPPGSEMLPGGETDVRDYLLNRVDQKSLANEAACRRPSLVAFLAR